MEKYSNQWLQIEDKSTHFFHVSVKINMARNNIYSMMMNDVLVDQEDVIANYVFQYYVVFSFTSFKTFWFF